MKEPSRASPRHDLARLFELRKNLRCIQRDWTDNFRVHVSTAESPYIEKKSYPSRFTHGKHAALREAEEHIRREYSSETEWLRCVEEEFPKYLPFLKKQCRLQFHGRILEIGAGGAWFSAELSKLPNVVQVIATDFSQKLLREKAPKVFKLLKARGAKITRMPADFHKLDFPNNHFDFVVCSAVLHQAVSMVQALKEARRVLKPGGRIVAIREPVWPLLKFKSRSATSGEGSHAGTLKRLYTLAEYRAFFATAGFELKASRVNLSSGFKYLFDEVVNGLTHARYVLIAAKKARG